MKILYIHTCYKYKGGEDIVCNKEIELMRQAGCSVDTLIFNNSRYTFLKFLLAPFNPFSFYIVYKKLAAVKPDVVHIHNWSFAASPSVFWAVKSKGIPLVHTLHNFRILCPSATLSYKQQLYTESIKSLFPWKSIGRGVYQNSILLTFWMLFITRFNYLLGTWNKIDRFIALTNNSKDIFENSYLKIKSSRITVKPNFTESDCSMVIPRRSDIFLYVGRLSEEKGVDKLLKAFSGSTYKLRIIGDGPLRSTVESFASKYQNICYLGFKSKDEVIKELTESTALIFPSICFETFGMSIIEAFSTGTAVIGSNIGSAPDLIKNAYNGFLFKPGDAADLKSKIANWSNLSVGDKDVFYKNAWNTYKEHYTPESNRKRLLNIYSSLINLASRSKPIKLSSATAHT